MKFGNRKNKRSTRQAGDPDARRPSAVPDPLPVRADCARRKWTFRIVALVSGPLLILAALEFLLQLVGLGYPSHFFIAARIQDKSKLCENQKFGWRFFPPAVARTPRPAAFAAVKPAGTCRIFVFGESAAFGDPSPAFGLPRMLEVLLRNRYPHTRFEVINAAMTAINSNVILPIARDCAPLDGDVWVFYMGHNEVVGPFGAGTVFGPQVPSLRFIRTAVALKAARIGQLLDAVQQWASGADQRWQTWSGMESFANQEVGRDDPRLAAVYEHFRQNLSDLLKLASSHGTKVVVSTIASNLKDCAPFASLHQRGFPDSAKTEWNRLYALGIQEEEAGRIEAALEAYRRAGQLDDQYADLQFRWARCLWARSDFAGARQHFIQARDDDALRFRADSRINDIIRQMAGNHRAQGILLADGAEALARLSPHEAPGQEFIWEHVHLNFEGNYHLARFLAEQVETMLPPTITQQDVSPQPWPSAAEGARQLAYTEWDCYETLEVLRQRLERVPFTRQLNHQQQYLELTERLKGLRAALTPATLQAGNRACRAALALAPEDWTLHELSARFLERSGDSAGAIEQWQRVLVKLPHYAEGHHRLGTLLDHQGRTAEAVPQLNAALKLKARFPEALDALAHAFASQGQYSQAVLLDERAIRLKPEFVSARINLGEAFIRLGQKDKAEACLREALRLDPENTQASLRLGQLLNDSGQVTEAIAEYAAAARVNPRDGHAHYRWGKALQALGRFAEAQFHFAEAVRIQPDFAEAQSQLGFELARQGKEAEAMVHFAAAAKLKPDLAEAHLNLGVAYAKQQNFSNAIIEFNQALHYDPTNATAQQYLQAAQKLQRGRP